MAQAPRRQLSTEEVAANQAKLKKQIADFLKEKLDAYIPKQPGTIDPESIQGIKPGDVSVYKGDGSDTTVIMMQEAAVKKVAGGASDGDMAPKQEKVGEVLKKILSSLGGDEAYQEFKPNPSSKGSVTEFSVGKSLSDFAYDIAMHKMAQAKKAPPGGGPD